MFVFILKENEQFAKAITLLSDLDNLFYLKFTPEMLSVMSKPRPSSNRCTIALQLSPSFFNQQYSCQLQLHYSLISANRFFSVFNGLVQNRFSSLTFSFSYPRRAYLTFQGPYGRYREVDLDMFYSDGSLDFGDINWGTFVSFSSQHFMDIVKFNNFHLVHVTLTNSQVKFSAHAGSYSYRIFTQERRECIIGGVAANNEIEFVVTFRPKETLRNLVRTSERVWLFKSNNPICSKGVVCIPFGLYARFLVYSCSMY